MTAAGRICSRIVLVRIVLVIPFHMQTGIPFPTCLTGCMQRYMGEMDRERTDTGENGKAENETNGDRNVVRTTSTRAAAAMRS
jgi:hypothetical protein